MPLVINRPQMPMKYLDFKGVSIIDFFANATWELHDRCDVIVWQDA